MEFHYKTIKIKKKTLVQEGCLSMNDTGICLLTGKNGAGKTLLLSQIYEKYQKRAIFCKQENDGILEHFSVVENISMTKNKAVNDEISKKLAFYGLEHLLPLHTKKMSGGEKRMVCLLRAIFSNRSIVFIDEPTNDLDYIMVEKLTTIIKDYEEKKLFFMITHDSRFYAIAEKVFIIENNVVRIRQEKEREKIAEHNKENVMLGENGNIAGCKLSEGEGHNKTGRDFIQIWKKNRIGICFFILISILVINYMAEIVQINEETLEANLKENQINLFVPVSSMEVADLFHGAINIKLAEEILNANLWKNSKEIVKTNERTDTGTAIKGIVLNETKNYEVYPMEFFNQEERAYKYPLDVYLTDFLGEEYDTAWIDVSDIMGNTFMDMLMDCEGKRYEFDKRLYDKSVKKIAEEEPKNGKKNEPVYITVILKQGYGIEDFLKDSSVKQQLTAENIYLQSNETIKTCNQLKFIITYKELMKDMCTLCVLILVIEILFHLAYLFYKKKDMRILYDYGLEIGELKKNILKCENDMIWRGLIALVIGAGCFLYLYVDKKAFVILNYFPVIYLLLIAIFSWKIREVILKKAVDIFCSWKYR